VHIFFDLLLIYISIDRVFEPVVLRRKKLQLQGVFLPNNIKRRAVHWRGELKPKKPWEIPRLLIELKL